jgi:DNA-binding MarR family transcriptional regulator
MKALSKRLALDSKRYYNIHLSIVNAIIPTKLTPKEIDVLSLFMSLKGDIAKDRFGTTARKLVMKELNLSDGGLGNYLKSLKEKGFISHTNEILSTLIPNDDKQEYFFQLINEEHVKQESID